MMCAKLFTSIFKTRNKSQVSDNELSNEGPRKSKVHIPHHLICKSQNE